MGEDSYGINRKVINKSSAKSNRVAELGVQIGVVIGGGNIFRGIARPPPAWTRATDDMGMLATVMNALALKDAMNKAGLVARVQSALAMQQVAEPYVRPKAMQYLEEGKIVVLAPAPATPFTTDTAAALRAASKWAPT